MNYSASIYPQAERERESAAEIITMSPNLIRSDQGRGKKKSELSTEKAFSFEHLAYKLYPYKHVAVLPKKKKKKSADDFNPRSESISEKVDL